MAKQKRDRSSVRTYRHFEELKDCLASGFSAPATRHYLVEMFNDNPPSEKAIQRWRGDHLETYQIVPEDYIRKFLRGVKFKVDLIQHLAEMVPMMRHRVSEGMRLEEEMFAGLPMAATEAAMKTYLETLNQYREVAQDLGLMTKAPSTPLIDARTQNLNVFSDEVKQAMLETEKMLREIELAPLAKLIEESKS